MEIGELLEFIDKYGRGSRAVFFKRFDISPRSAEAWFRRKPKKMKDIYDKYIRLKAKTLKKRRKK